MHISHVVAEALASSLKWAGFQTGPYVVLLSSGNQVDLDASAKRSMIAQMCLMPITKSST